MKIGIDCRTILNPDAGHLAGVSHYIYYLVKNLLQIDKKNEYVLFFSPRTTNINEFKQKNSRVEIFPFFKYKRYLPFSYSHLLVSAFLQRQKLDLYHSPANIIPLYYDQPSVVTVHDLAIYDHPEWFPTRFVNNQSFATKILVPKSIKKAKKVIAVSENTKKDIQRLFKVFAGKISVIHEGAIYQKPTIPFSKLKKKYKLQDEFILFIGTIEPRKNLERLINAYRGLVATDKIKHQLVIAGNLGWGYKNIIMSIKELNAQKPNSVRYVGYVAHEEKFTLLKKSACFVFPSLYEGFGIPILEAMSQGTPVITSNCSSLPEVANEAAILVDPNKTGEIVKAILDILDDKTLQQRLAVLGKARVKKFSWKKTAEETLRVYKKV